MNDVVLFLYFADVMPSIGRIFALFAWGTAITYVIEWVAFVVSEGECCKQKHHCLVYFTLALSLISAFVPDKHTIYLIGAAKASAEFGQAVGNSDIAQKTMKVLNQELDKMLTPPEGKK
jgi:hypothetical protein